MTITSECGMEKRMAQQAHACRKIIADAHHTRNAQKQRMASELLQLQQLQLQIDLHSKTFEKQHPGTPSTVAGSPACSRYNFHLDSDLCSSITSSPESSSCLRQHFARKSSLTSVCSRKSVTFSDNDNEIFSIPCRIEDEEIENQLEANEHGSPSANHQLTKNEESGVWHSYQHEFGTEGRCQHPSARGGKTKFKTRRASKQLQNGIQIFGAPLGAGGPYGYGSIAIGIFICFSASILRIDIDDAISSSSSSANHHLLWLLFDVALAYMVGLMVGLNESMFTADEL